MKKLFYNVQFIWLELSLINQATTGEGDKQNKENPEVFVNQPISIQRQKGIYQLLIYLPKSVYIKIGKKGTFRFPKGYYIYTGSAKNGLKTRVERHLRKKKKHFWHIDYLLDHASVKKVFLFSGDRLDECSLSEKVLKKSKATVIVPKFGASDCNCPSHLVFFGRLKDVPKSSRTYSFPFTKG